MATKEYRVTTTMTQGWKVEAKVRQHHLVIDQPSGDDSGANPLETFLFSLGGCLSAIAKMVAREQGFTLNGIKVDVTATLDPAGLSGKPTESPIGFSKIDAKADIDADLTEAEKLAFFELVCHRCPIHDNLVNPTIVTHQVASDS